MTSTKDCGRLPSLSLQKKVKGKRYNAIHSIREQKRKKEEREGGHLSVTEKKRTDPPSSTPHNKRKKKGKKNYQLLVTYLRGGKGRKRKELSPRTM